MPEHALAVYETLREQVVRGQPRPEGLGSVVFHGMWRGLVVLLQAQPPSTSSPANTSGSPAPVAHDPQLVRLLANMLLLTHSRVEYAY